MHLFTSKTSRLIPGLAGLVLLLAANASQAQTVNLTAAPTSTIRNVLVSTSICTRPCVAPSAMRMPISCVFCVTEYEITP